MVGGYGNDYRLARRRSLKYRVLFFIPDDSMLKYVDEGMQTGRCLDFVHRYVWQRYGIRLTSAIKHRLRLWR